MEISLTVEARVALSDGKQVPAITDNPALVNLRFTQILVCAFGPARQAMGHDR